MVRRPGRFALALVALAAASATATARAQDRDPRELEAKKACLGGRTDRGIELLAEMYAETNDPTYIYNQGRCFQQSGRPREALTRFREYMRKAPNMAADDKALVQGYISELEEQLKTSPAPDLSARPPTDNNQVVVSKPESKPDESPAIYTRWWFWTGVGAVVAGGVITALLVTRPSDPTPYRGDLTPGTVSVPSQ
jgi:hypothetical protein